MKKKFTKSELDKLERLNYLANELNKGRLSDLANELNNGGLSHDEYDEYEELIMECESFFPAIKS